MRAVLCRSLDGYEALTIDEVPRPQPGPNQVLVRVEAAALNFADLLITQGRYQEKPELPFVPGFELAGEVVALGPEVTAPGLGMKVLAVVPHGAYAEFAVADAATAVPLPAGMDVAIAAAFPIAYGTSHIGLADRAALKPGEWVLIHGAAGGVGLTAVEIAKAMGARVIATARDAEKAAVARAHGADHAFDLQTLTDLRTTVKELTDGRGVDVCYDPVGGELGELSLRCLAWEGRYLAIGFAAGRPPEVKANHLLVKNTAVLGLYWGSYQQHAPERFRASLDQLLVWWCEGALKPLVSERYPLSQVHAALATLKARRSTGKLVLEPAF